MITIVIDHRVRRVVVEYDGQPIAQTAFDDSGWAGMAAVEETARAVATALGSEVEVTEL